MDSRERVLMAIEGKEPDRVPLDVGGLISGINETAYRNFLQLLGWDLPVDYWDYILKIVTVHEKVLRRFGVDTRHIRLKKSKKKGRFRIISNDTLVDDYGILWKKRGLYYEMESHPLADAKTIADSENYEWLRFDESRVEGLRRDAKRLSEAGYAVIVDGFSPNVFEMGTILRGVKKFYIDFLRNQDMVEWLFEKAAQMILEFTEGYLNEVADYALIFEITDDYGMQDRMLISPKLWREFVKPWLIKIYNFIKKRFNLKILHHSCGSIRPIIGDLIECGVDILNPIQPLAKDMKPAEIKRDFGNELCFHGAIDVQHVMPFGTVKDVKSEVKKRINELAWGGGYIAATSHNILSEVPPENILSLFESIQNYGKYPLRK